MDRKLRSHVDIIILRYINKINENAYQQFQREKNFVLLYGVINDFDRRKSFQRLRNISLTTNIEIFEILLLYLLVPGYVEKIDHHIFKRC